MILNWLCLRLPYWITPDILTGLGIIGAILVFAGYLGSRFNISYVWLSTFGYFVHWFGDSLDGSLARFRQIERPKYGYFLDHSVDAACNLVIMVGLGLTPFVRLDVALFALIGYYMLCMYVFLNNQVTGIFQLSFMAMGPTELRIGLIAINFCMYFEGNLGVNLGGTFISAYDVLLLGTSALLIGIFVYHVVLNIRLLRAQYSQSPRPMTGVEPSRVPALSRAATPASLRSIQIANHSAPSN